MVVVGVRGVVVVVVVLVGIRDSIENWKLRKKSGREIKEMMAVVVAVVVVMMMMMITTTMVIMVVVVIGAMTMS